MKFPIRLVFESGGRGIPSLYFGAAFLTISKGPA